MLEWFVLGWKTNYVRMVWNVPPWARVLAERERDIGLLTLRAYVT